MTRYALASTFALIGGAATLLMVASILYSCRQGGTPHDMGNQSWVPDASEQSAHVAATSNRTDTIPPSDEILQIDLGVHG